ncbi:helix-turn-helix domain-containing protein [Achromobacter marplatensis]|uniref:helix-turn-helix domain-containing protein n=1 Tax=Achromobacter marplatensis TaxID=470868 RepID=UPI0039F6C030
MNLAPFFGLAIRRHRELLRLSQEDLADRARIDRTYISGVERGVRNPSLEVMQRIAEGLGADLDVIFCTARELAVIKESEGEN